MWKSPCFAETLGKYVQIRGRVFTLIFPEMAYKDLSIVSLLHSFPAAIFSSSGHETNGKASSRN